MAKIIKLFITTVCAAVLCAVIIISSMAVASAQEVQNTAPDALNRPEAAASGNETVDRAAEEAAVESRLLTMLNMNYCYGEVFEDATAVAERVAVTLADYATEVGDAGFCVNNALISAFIYDFYGIAADLDNQSIETGPAGYTAVPNAEIGTMVHTPVSIVENGDIITVVSCVEIYFGGNDMETFLAKSKFKVNPQSAYGYNLIASELL